LDGALEQLLHLRLAGDVGAMREGAASRLLDGPDDVHGGVFAVAVVDDDVRAGAAERERNGASEAGVGAGDDGLLALQRSVGGHFSAPEGGTSLGTAAPQRRYRRNRICAATVQWRVTAVAGLRLPVTCSGANR